jgi:hypothetical protein
VPERGVEHPSRPSQPVALRPPKTALTRGSASLTTSRHAILSSPVLTGPLANGLQKGGHAKINNA